jgi:hypothetical protein
MTTEARPTVKRAVLVYQVGIANVFAVDRWSHGDPSKRRVRRLMQHAYRPCIDFARGLAAAGVMVRTAHCDECGDIADRPWTAGPGDLWRESKARITEN